LHQLLHTTLVNLHLLLHADESTCTNYFTRLS